MDKKIHSLVLLLTITFGVVGIVGGLDKFFNILTDWQKYIPSYFLSVSPIDPAIFMMIVGVVEIVAGVLLFTRWKSFAACVFFGWILLIALNLIIAGFYDIAVRDVVIAIAAFVMARLIKIDRKI